MRQMEPYFFGRKVVFSIPDVSERFKESISSSPANFKKISLIGRLEVGKLGRGPQIL